MIYKIVLITAVVMVLGIMFSSNLLTLIGIPVSSVVGYLETIAHNMANLVSITDLVFADGSGVLLVKFLLYFVFFYVNYRVVMLVLSFFKNG